MVDNMDQNLDKLSYDELLELESSVSEFIKYLEDLYHSEVDADE